MNILIEHGFEANYSIGFARGLASNGVTLVVLSSDETEGRLSAAGIRNINLLGSQSESRSVWEKSLNMLRYYSRLLLFVIRNRGETFHFIGQFRNEFILFEGVFLNAFFKMLAGRYIYTAHNLLPHGRERSHFFRWVYRIVYSIPDVLVAHTQKTRQALIGQFGVPAAKIHVMSIGLNEEVPASSLGRRECRARFGCDGAAQLILFFGRIAEYKGVDLLIEAFDSLELPKTRLIIAGPFRSSSYRELILAKIDSARRRADISLDARVIPNDEVGVFFGASDVLCLPYRNIHQSGPLFLAMRFGKPVVATNVGSFADFVTEDTGIIAPSNDAQGIANALMDFFSSPERFRGESILAEAQKYRWDRVCQILLPLYKPDAGSGFAAA